MRAEKVKYKQIDAKWASVKRTIQRGRALIHHPGIGLHHSLIFCLSIPKRMMRIMIMIMMEPRAAAGFTHSLCNYYIMPYTLIMAGGEWDHSNIPFHIIMLQSTAHPFTPTLSRFIILGLLLRTVWMTNYSEIYVDIYPLKTHTSCFMVVHDATSILLILHLMSACSMSYLI